MAALKSTEQIRQEILDKFGGDIHLVSEYLGAQKNITLGCNYGHTWEVLATNLLSRGTRSKCKECEGKGSNKTIFWGKDNLDKLKQLISISKTLPEIVEATGWTSAQINNACAKYNLSRPKLDMTIRKLSEVLLQQNRELISNFDDIATVYSKVVVVCNKGHIHTQNIYNIINDNTGCPSCFFANGISKGETELLDFIKSIYKDEIIEHDRIILKGKEIDIILPKLNLAFEYNGTYFHREDKVGKRYHLDKQIVAGSSGIHLVHIFEDEWINKKDICKSRIKSLLGLNTKIYARKCIVKSIEFPKEFLEINHIQGAGVPTKHNLGLYYQEKLVAVITLSAARYTKDFDYELVRYCSKIDTNVVGGGSKLLKEFKRKNSGSIISYSDNRWSTGNFYKKLGFKFLRTSEPGYSYYKKLKKYSRITFQKHKLKELFPNTYQEDLTEKQIMNLEGYYAVYDCGTTSWTLK